MKSWPVLLPETNSDHRMVLHFHVHHPRRLRAVSTPASPGQSQYFDDALTRTLITRMVEQCYLPVNDLLLTLIGRYPTLRIALSLSGLVLELLERYTPQSLAGFQKLVCTGVVEVLAETYYHSLSGLVAGDEFEVQILQHAEKVYEHFNVRPSVFRNTGLIYTDEIGSRIAHLGYRGILAEVPAELLDGRDEHRLYSHPDHPHVKILLCNMRLNGPLSSPDKRGNVKVFLSRLQGTAAHTQVNVIADYEAFAGTDTVASGFLSNLLTGLAEERSYRMCLPSDVLDLAGAQPLSVKGDHSGGGPGLSRWLGNDMQRTAFDAIMKIEHDVKVLGDRELIRDWRFLQTSDHFSTLSSDEEFRHYMNLLSNLAARIQTAKDNLAQGDHDLTSREAERQDTKAHTPVWVMNLESVPQWNVPEKHD